jgi:hypothetical protein
MELRDPIRSVLQHKGGAVWSVPPSASVYDAIALMSAKQVASVEISSTQFPERGVRNAALPLRPDFAIGAHIGHY